MDESTLTEMSLLADNRDRAVRRIVQICGGNQN